MTSFAMPIASDAVVDALNATLATTKKAEASAMASQEEAGHVDAPCEWWGLEVSAARATLGEEVGVYAAMRWVSPAIAAAAASSASSAAR